MENRRMILAIVLSIACILGYQLLFAPSPGKGPPPAPAPGATSGGPPGGPPGGPDNARLASGAPAGPAPGMAAARAVAPREITVATPLYTAVVATAGGGIRSFRLARYKDEAGPGGVPLDVVGLREKGPFPLELHLEGSEPAIPGTPVFAADAPGRLEVGPGKTASVVLTWTAAGGTRITREYVFSGDRYEFDVRAQVTNGSKGVVRVVPGLEITQEFTGPLGSDSYTFQGVAAGRGRSVDRHTAKDIAKGKVGKGPVAWAAADAKYFALVVVPEKEWTLSRVAMAGETAVRFALTDAPAALAPGDAVRFSAKAFFGPKEYNLLEAAGKGLEGLVDYGWFSFLAKPLVWLLQSSHRATRNYGIDIILLTVLIKILFYPLTQKSMASMRKMQELSPIITKIREKHKDDPARMNQEVMNLYRTYKINPLGGCLPMLLQIPVFIALYKGLLVAIELRHSPFLLWINDLSSPEHLIDIPVAGYAIPIRLLPLLMGISMFVQQKMTPSAGMDPAQAKVMLLLPVIFTFMFWSFPTGLVLYWLVNNLLQIGQQLVHDRRAAAKAAGPA